MSDRKCDNCKYYEEYNEESINGLCHRFPPQVYPEHPDRTHDRSSSKQPEVYGDDWCGEFEKS